ncbi:hypothetical protein HMI54_006679 [Coelomomyces lativittatus]|nr:hypothetical protein HMI54_006679 [Coelomomyces lativittatus]
MASDFGPANSYSAAIDMWACGCILAELLTMQKESEEQPDERAALFPGKTCFPLSADTAAGKGSFLCHPPSPPFFSSLVLAAFPSSLRSSLLLSRLAFSMTCSGFCFRQGHLRW